MYGIGSKNGRNKNGKGMKKDEQRRQKFMKYLAGFVP